MGSYYSTTDILCPKGTKKEATLWNISTVLMEHMIRKKEEEIVIKNVKHLKTDMYFSFVFSKLFIV